MYAAVSAEDMQGTREYASQVNDPIKTETEADLQSEKAKSVT